MLDELARRLEKRRKNKPIGPPLFFAFDELPVICDLVKDAPAKAGQATARGPQGAAADRRRITIDAH
jgi:hypothetical protein